MIARGCFFASLIFLAAVSAAPADETALALITRDGGRIDPGELAPGLAELTADSAFPVLKDARGRALAAGGEALDGRGGRRVAFAHDGFLKSPALIDQSANLNLIANAIRWCGRSDSPKVALAPDLNHLADALRKQGLKVELMAPADLDPANPPAVYLAIAQREWANGGTAKVLSLAEKGMGLVLAATPWPFADDHPNFDLFPANLLTLPAGFRLRPDGYADKSRPFAVSFSDSRSVLAALMELTAEPSAARPEQIAKLAESASLRGPALDEFLVGLRRLNETIGPIVPTTAKPLIPGTNPLVDAVVNLESELNQNLPAGKMYAIPAASDYPGAVPADAGRVEKRLNIDGTWRGWLSGRGAGAWAAKEMRPAGLYAAPGEVITVTVPERIAGKGFEIVIGTYGGGLASRKEWHRYPELQRAVEIDETATRISNGLGGLITIRVPRGAGFGEFEIGIAGAVAAPLYIDGKTDLREWREQIRLDPAPWAELASKRMIIALPSELIRRLDDPDRVMQVWDEIVGKAAELCGGVNRDRYRAERLVFDRQTAAGYMHSGYPVAAHLDRAAQLAVDAAALRSEGSWGFFHEYGHNHQHDLWALPGTGETTCNLWSVYLFEEYIGKKRELGHDSVRQLDRRQRMNDYFKNGRKFEADWSMWVALEAYLQVQETFGWEPFKKVFAEYNTLPEVEWPKTQQEKNDQWVIRLSRACGKDLAPFWSAWGLPLSQPVSEALKELPAWDDHPVAGLAK